MAVPAATIHRMESADARVGLVERGYAALDSGDVDAFLAEVAPDAVVRYPAAGVLPYGGEWRGRQAIARFLDVHDAAEEILEFDVIDIVPGDERIFTTGRFRGRSRVTGREWATPFVHVFTVAEGGITSWEAFFDTAAAVTAHGGADSG